VAALLDLDADKLTGDTSLGDMGWDSVNALRVLVYLEGQLNACLDYERFIGAATLADLVAVVRGAIEPDGGRVR
jgi:acyl carrier protein